MSVAIILPSLNPDEKLLKTLNALVDEGFDNIVLVDDGSKEECQKEFDEARKLPGVTVLVHEVNKGKGRALKTAYQHVYEKGGVVGVVTIDGDGQHTIPDIKNLAKELIHDSDRVILGSREFDAKNTPFKNKFGNKFTSLSFLVFCGLKIRDTQTGLRAFPLHLLPMMCEIEGERFEYETNVLLTLGRKNIKIDEETIETVYLNNNETSHFKPSRDSVAIFALILQDFFRFFLVSASSFIIDLGLFALFCAILPQFEIWQRVAVATVLSRIISGVFNFFANKIFVFKSNDSIAKSGIKYLILFFGILITSTVLVSGISEVLKISDSVFLKAIVDASLFLVSYQIQNKFIFEVKNG